MKKEKLISIKNDCLQVYKMLQTLEYLFGKKDNNMDLDMMNNWLLNIIKFYKIKGIELTKDDFSINGDDVANKIVMRYMNLFYLNIGNSDNNTENYSKLIFNMPELEFSVNDSNPIFDYVYEAVKNIRNKHIRVVDDILNGISNYLKHFGIEKVNLDNISVVKDKLLQKIKYIDSLIKQVDDSLEKERLKKSSEEKLCMLVTDNKYINMDDEGKKYVLDNLHNICLTIIKLKIFYTLSSKYYEYSRLSNYDKILEVVEDKKRKISILNERISELSKKSGRDSKILKLSKKKMELADEVSSLIRNYLTGFYFLCNLDKLENECNVSGMYDSEKLFGEFDFESLPVDFREVNARGEYKSHGIKLPDVSSQEFENLSVLALKYLNRDDDLLNNKKGEFSRKRAIIN